MQATSVISNFQGATYQKKKKRKNPAEISIDNTFYGTQYLQNIAI